MILNKMHYSMKTPVNSASIFICTAEILSARSFLILSNMQRMIYQFLYTFILCSGNRYYRYSQHFLHFVYMYGATVGVHLIHHIESQHHRNIQLHKLHCKIQISLNICRIDNIDNTLWGPAQQELSGNNLFTGIG